MASGAGQRPRGCSTICLPFDQHDYERAVNDPAAFRAALDRFFLDMPELFPGAVAKGYLLKDSRLSKKLGLRLGRVVCDATGEAFFIRPSFTLPYMAGSAADRSGRLLLGPSGVPARAWPRAFRQDAMYCFRLEGSLGRASVARTTPRRAGLPAHLLADEHRQTRDGQKNYIATPVGAGCCL